MPSWPWHLTGRKLANMWECVHRARAAVSFEERPLAKIKSNLREWLIQLTFARRRRSCKGSGSSVCLYTAAASDRVPNSGQKFRCHPDLVATTNSWLRPRVSQQNDDFETGSGVKSRVCIFSAWSSRTLRNIHDRSDPSTYNLDIVQRHRARL